MEILPLYRQVYHLHKKAGNVRKQSFEEIWENSDVFKTLRNRDKLEGKCHICDYRYECGGKRCSVFAKTGSITQEDAGCWFNKQQLKKPLVFEEVGCEYCSRKPQLVCQLCGSLICDDHVFYCPICKESLCHPDARDCFFKHSC